jgi:hypothetical protein
MGNPFHPALQRQVLKKGAVVDFINLFAPNNDSPNRRRRDTQLSGRFRQRQTDLARERHGQSAPNGRHRAPAATGPQIPF